MLCQLLRATVFYDATRSRIEAFGFGYIYNSIFWVRAAADITDRDLSRDHIDKTSIHSHKLQSPEYLAAVVDSVDSDGREL